MTDFLDALRPHYDVPAEKPCLRRINHEGTSKYETSTVWCLLQDGHRGACNGPAPSILELDDLGPMAARRRRF